MEKLIRAYLKHTGYYYADNSIRQIDNAMKHGDFVYVVEFTETGTWNGVDEVDVSVSDLLVFLFERQA